LLGLALGCLAAGMVRHPTRINGWIPYATVGMAIVFFLDSAVSFPVGVFLGLIEAPLNFTYLDRLRREQRPVAFALRWAVILTAVLGTTVLWPILAEAGAFTRSEQFLVLALAAVLVSVAAWRLLLRDALEFFLSIFCIPLYRFRFYGPGANHVPRFGPLLVIANHGAYVDPFWLGKILPRHITPMMSSQFFDLPIVSWLMRRVERTIRVQESRYRQDAPELREAVARLDRGECVLLFPEGWVRRREDQLLRRFGQGVWRILHERPRTPVVACWIEGGWRSYTSFYNGPPGRGKPIDFLRTVSIALAMPGEVPPDVLADKNATRQYLMEAVVSLRRYLPHCDGPAADAVCITAAQVSALAEADPD
jgi:1-acyl-sn-glycerol-3-phosphate acyltransferase